MFHAPGPSRTSRRRGRVHQTREQTIGEGQVSEVTVEIEDKAFGGKERGATRVSHGEAFQIESEEEGIEPDPPDFHFPVKDPSDFPLQPTLQETRSQEESQEGKDTEGDRQNRGRPPDLGARETEGEPHADVSRSQEIKTIRP